MSRREEKTTKIIYTTIQLLVEEGAGGLTMRKVAKLANITLSNLQYYYKDKNALLEATIENYFDQNEKKVTESITQLPQDIEFIQLLEIILEQALIDGNDNDRCAMFREIWALSTKNAKIETLVRLHYQKYNDWLVQQFSSYSSNAAIIISLLMPYVEGYSLMGNALPLPKEKIIAHLIKMILPYID